MRDTRELREQARAEAEPVEDDEERDSLIRAANTDGTAHYRQKAKRLAREKAFYVGALAGGIAVFIALFVWEVLQA